MSRFFTAASLPALSVFCPFAAGYFLSFCFRNVNAVISKELVALYKAGLCIALAMLALLAGGVLGPLRVLLGVYAFACISGALCYALLTPLFAPAMTGRVNTAANMLMFTASFVLQWSIGAVLKLYPVVDGRYSSAGYIAAFTALALLQLTALAWLLPMRVVEFGDAGRIASGRDRP
jgi:hypothetical protein